MATPAAGSASTLGAANLFSVHGLVAVVTGGGTGIGLMITKALVANGASKVYILGRRLPMLEEAAKAVGSPAAVPLQCDVTSKRDLEAAAARIGSEVGYVNLLVCNAGITGPFGFKPTPETSLDHFVEANLSVDFDEHTKVFAVNATAVWFTTMSFLKLLEGNLEQTSQVVTISSIGGFNKVNTGGYAYSQSKAACTHLVKQLSVVLPQWGIRANVICPGLYPSEMSAPLVGKGGPLGKHLVPLGRTGYEEDMSGNILYLASKAGAYSNGAVLVTDGGRLGLYPSTF